MQIEEKNVYFHELDVGDIVDATVILDIDGTLVCSVKNTISPAVRRVVEHLKEHNDVYIFSNNPDGTRSRDIAKELGLPYIVSSHKKPNKKVVQDLEKKKQTIVAIGDKYLTDHLFAQFIGAYHIRVRRYRCKNESFAYIMGCIFDDTVYALARLLRIVS